MIRSLLSFCLSLFKSHTQLHFEILFLSENNWKSLPRKGNLFHFLSRLSVIVVMQPTQNSTHTNRTPCLLRFTCLRNLLLNPLMRSLTIKVTKKVIMSTLKVGYAFQSKRAALQTSDGIDPPCAALQAAGNTP